MYKEIVILTLLAVATSGFPASGTSEGDDDSTENSGSFLPEGKSIIPFRTSSGNPDELIGNAAELATNPRKVRSGCVVVGIFASCKSGVPAEVAAKQIEDSNNALYAFLGQTQERFLGLVSKQV